MTGHRRSQVHMHSANLARLTCTVALVALLSLIGARCLAEEPRRLSGQLMAVLEAEGVEATEAFYRERRHDGFAGTRESQADTNALGYRLLERGETASAIRVFRLNAETYPQSANAFDSLGEACLAAGDRAGAVAAYQQALALDPRSRGARYELARLTGRALPPFPILVLAHILAGALSLAAGAVAMAAPKGGRVHLMAGKTFVVAMVAMAGSAVIRAAQHLESEVLNFWMGNLALYLVISGWRAARRRPERATLLDRGLSAMAVAVAGGLLVLGAGKGAFAGAALVFGTVAGLAAVADVRWFRRPSPDRARWLVRHLWRMGLAMFIAVGSVFLGQPQVFPYEIRSSGVLVMPSLLVTAAFAYWFVRYRFGRQLRQLRPFGAT